MKRGPRWMGVFLLVAVFVAGCDGFDYDLNDAILEITPEGATESVLQHEPGRSEVRISAPARGFFTATFIYHDPRVELSISVDAEEVAEREDLTFPIDEERLQLEVEFGDEAFSAAAEGAQGAISIERLDQEGERVSFRSAFHGTLVAEDGSKAAVNGFIDALQDDASTSP